MLERGFGVSETAPELVDVSGVQLQWRERGAGPRLLFLEPHVGLWKADAFLDGLAEHYTVCSSSEHSAQLAA